MKHNIFVTLIGFSIILFTAIPVLSQTGSMNITKTEKDEMVTYKVNLTPNSSISAADIMISYNPKHLKVSNFNRGDIGESENSVMATNHIESDGLIYISFASLDDNAMGGTICSLTFKKLEEYQSIQEKQFISNTSVASSEEPIVPSIGINISGAYNADGQKLDPLINIGDSTIIVIQSGERITDYYTNSEIEEDGSINEIRDNPSNAVAIFLVFILLGLGLLIFIRQRKKIR